MGLMDRAEVALNRKGNSNPEKKKTGLLDRVSCASLYDGLTAVFRDWLKAIHADRGGLLCSLTGGDWHLLCASGLDLTTVNRFAVPASLMDRFIDDQKWIRISDRALDHFRPFFSSREADSLQSLHIRCLGTIKDLRVCALFADSTLSRYRSTLEQRDYSNIDTDTLWKTVSDNGTVLPLLLPGKMTEQGSIEEKTRSLLSSGMKSVMISLSLEEALGSREIIATDPQTAEIYRAIVTRIKKKAGASNIVRICEDFSVRIVLFSTQAIDFDMYVRQMLSPLEKAFGIPRINRINISSGGKTESLQDILKFARGCD